MIVKKTIMQLRNIQIEKSLEHSHYLYIKVR